MNVEKKFSKPRPHLTKAQRLPKTYRAVEKILNDVKACKSSIKNVLNNTRLKGYAFKKVYSLAINVLKNRPLLDKIIEETKLLQKEKFLRKEIAGILVYELVMGGGLPGESLSVLAVTKHQEDIYSTYNRVKNDVKLPSIGPRTIPLYVRVNTLLTSIKDVLKDLSDSNYFQIEYPDGISEIEYLDMVRSLTPGNFLVDYHFKDLLVFAPSDDLSSWPLFQKRHVCIQDKSSCIPVKVLNPEPGSTVMDACAAPGMKTVHIAAAMKNTGLIYACERNKERYQTLLSALDSAGVKICQSSCQDFTQVDPSDRTFEDVEYVLVDPSCSGSGMVSRMDAVTDTEDSKNASRLQNLAKFQIVLLKHALKFGSAKRVVYSTCSLSEEENEYVVHEALGHFRDLYKIVPVMPGWSTRGSENYEFGSLCLRAHPDTTLTNGFFVAMFERLDDDEKSAEYPKANKSHTTNAQGKRPRDENRVEEPFFETTPREPMSTNAKSKRKRTGFNSEIEVKSSRSLEIVDSSGKTEVTSMENDVESSDQANGRIATNLEPFYEDSNAEPLGDSRGHDACSRSGKNRKRKKKHSKNSDEFHEVPESDFSGTRSTDGSQDTKHKKKHSKSHGTYKEGNFNDTGPINNNRKTKRSREVEVICDETPRSNFEDTKRKRSKNHADIYKKDPFVETGETINDYDNNVQSTSDDVVYEEAPESTFKETERRKKKHSKNIDEFHEVPQSDFSETRSTDGSQGTKHKKKHSKSHDTYIEGNFDDSGSINNNFKTKRLREVEVICDETPQSNFENTKRKRSKKHADISKKNPFDETGKPMNDSDVNVQSTNDDVVYEETPEGAFKRTKRHKKKRSKNTDGFLTQASECTMDPKSLNDSNRKKHKEEYSNMNGEIDIIHSGCNFDKEVEPSENHARKKIKKKRSKQLDDMSTPYRPILIQLD